MGAFRRVLAKARSFAAGAGLLVASSCGRTEVLHGATGPADAGLPPAACRDGRLRPTHDVAPVLFLIDRSGSMGFDLEGHAGGIFGQPLTGPTRWEVLKGSLGAALAPHDRELAMGAILFPGDDACGAPAGLVLEPRPGNAAALLALFDTSPGGGTPTAAAVGAVEREAARTRAHAAVLITDGQPNCNPALHRETCVCTAPLLGFPPTCTDVLNCLDEGRSVEALLRLRVDAGVTTTVIGVATADSQVAGTLDLMASAGGAPVGGHHQFYSATSAAELTSALTTISASLTNCAWSTHTAMSASDTMAVFVGDAGLPSDGWAWTAQEQGSFSLLGPWCARAAAGEPVTAVLACH